MSKKLSIVVPVYNKEKYIDKCIASILAQSNEDFELILVNDGSTDKSGTICDEWAKKDSRITVANKENGGASSARNIGAKQATGEYVLFVDSDDTINIHMVKCICDAAQGSDADIIRFGINNMFSKDKVNTFIPKNTKAMCPKSDATSFLVLMEDVYTPTKAYKRQFLHDNNIMFNESILLWEDTHFAVNAFSKASSVVTLRKALYNYNREDDLNCITKRGYVRAYEDYKIFISFYDDTVKNCGFENQKEIIEYRQWLTQRMCYGHFRYLCAKDKAINKQRYQKLLEIFTDTVLKENIIKVLCEENNVYSRVYLILFKIKSPRLMLWFIQIKNILL